MKSKWLRLVIIAQHGVDWRGSFGSVSVHCSLLVSIASVQIKRPNVPAPLSVSLSCLSFSLFYTLALVVLSGFEHFIFLH